MMLNVSIEVKILPADKEKLHFSIFYFHYNCPGLGLNLYCVWIQTHFSTLTIEYSKATLIFLRVSFSLLRRRRPYFSLDLFRKSLQPKFISKLKIYRVHNCFSPLEWDKVSFNDWAEKNTRGKQVPHGKEKKNTTLISDTLHNDHQTFRIRRDQDVHHPNISERVLLGTPEAQVVVFMVLWPGRFRKWHSSTKLNGFLSCKILRPFSFIDLVIHQDRKL